MRRRGVRGQGWYSERSTVERLKQEWSGIGPADLVVAPAEEDSAERGWRWSDFAGFGSWWERQREVEIRVRVRALGLRPVGRFVPTLGRVVLLP